MDLVTLRVTSHASASCTPLANLLCPYCTLGKMGLIIIIYSESKQHVMLDIQVGVHYTDLGNIKLLRFGKNSSITSLQCRRIPVESM